MATRTLSRLIRDNDGLDAVRDRLGEVERLQGRYRLVVPAPLGEASRVCAIDGSTVVVRALNAPVAAALRAMAPRLLAGLKIPDPGDKSLKYKRDEELTGLRVELQVAALPPRRAPKPRGPMPREALARVAEGLPEESPLRESLLRIAGDQTKSRIRSKR
mgnify:CR=1 FL=1